MLPEFFSQNELASLDTQALSQLWINFKQAETSANMRRVLIEQELFSRLEPTSREPGVQTYELKDTVVKVTRKFTWSVTNSEQLELLFANNQSIAPYSKKISVTDSKMRYLSVNSPDLFKNACRYTETKESKPHFDVLIKEKEKENGL